MKPRRLVSDTSLSITSGWVLAGIVLEMNVEARVCRPERSEGPARAGEVQVLRSLCSLRTTTLNPESYSSIQLGAQARRGRHRPAEQPRHDPVAVKAAVLDEHLVRVVARDHDPGDEQAGHNRLQ